MPSAPRKTTILTTKIQIRPEVKKEFAHWQAKLHALIATFPGFASLEILSPATTSDLDWVLMQRFDDAESAMAWRNSQERKTIYDGLQAYLTEDSKHMLQDKEQGFLIKKI